MKASGQPAFKYRVKSKVNGVDEGGGTWPKAGMWRGKICDGLALK
jgi:hypothetical protein